MKIPVPNFTQTPNDLFDKWLPHLGEAELKVILVIMRKTFGWHKIRDRISLSQLSTLTGLKKDHVINAARTLQEKGLIIKDVIGPNGQQQTYYQLVIEEESNISDQSLKETPPSPAEGPPPSPVKGLTKETITKETYLNKQQQQYKDIANASIPIERSAAAAQENLREPDIIYETSKKEKKSISQSYIYRHFSKFHYSNEIIKEAIEKMISENKIINNPLKFLESICKRLEENYKLKAKSLERLPEKQDTEIGYVIINGKKTPTEKPITWAEALERQKNVRAI